MGGNTVFSNLAGFSLRKLARMLGEGFGNKGEVSQARPYRDPAQQSGLIRNSFWSGSMLLHGVITDATALGNCYRVQLEKGHAPVICALATTGSHGAFGARSLATLSPGTQVLVSVHPQRNSGLILCAIPASGTAGNRQLHSLLHHATRNRVDEAHLQPYRQGGRGFAASWAAGRPFDATTVGEQGFITETGLRLFIDPFMVEMGVDEACGVTAFLHDQLLRIAGYNFRMFTAGMEREALDDQEEYNDWTGYTPYPWEQLGLFDRTDPRVEHEAADWQLARPWYGVWEPKTDKQRPWHREVEYHGYLGQGGLHIVQTMPADEQRPETAEFLQDNVSFPGLSIDFTGLDGRRIIGSAKGVSIVKRCFIPNPVRRYVPEQIDDEGDSPANYKHSGVAGDGPDHVIFGEIGIGEGLNGELTRTSGILDLHAYWFNYGCVHPFFYHQKDWNVFSEDQCPHTEGRTIVTPDYSQLEGSVFLKAPDPLSWRVDHRYGNVKYWQTQCGLEFLEDGGVVLYDGWGSELRMTAGSVWLSAAADAWINPGRTVNIWGGDDVNIRAKNSLDLVTSWRDVRIKAERNLHMLSGNSGEGGTLIECRAPDRFEFKDKCGEDVLSGGVFLRSENGTIGGWGTNVYWRIGGGDIPTGVMLLDCDHGSAPLITNSSALLHYATQGTFWHFNCIDGDCGGPSAAVTPSGTVWPGNMCNEKGVIFGGPGIFNGAVASTVGFAAVFCPFVGCLDGDALEKVQEAIEACYNILYKELPDFGSEFYDEVLEQFFYAEDKPGNDEVIRESEFSLRSPEQYGTKDFVFHEMRWQQMGRASGTIQNSWPERPVACRSEPNTYPYPGKDHFVDGAQSFYRQNLQMFNLQGDVGSAVNHGQRPTLADMYANPMFATQEPTSLDSYPVIRGIAGLQPEQNEQPTTPTTPVPPSVGVVPPSITPTT